MVLSERNDGRSWPTPGSCRDCAISRGARSKAAVAQHWTSLSSGGAESAAAMPGRPRVRPRSGDKSYLCQRSEQTMRTFSVALVLVALTWGVAYGELPSYAGPQAKPEASGMATAVLAGGCFWGVD